MSTCIIFFIGALASVASEAFWYGACRTDIALWGGAGMLLLRRIALRFPRGDKVLLCLVGALLLIILRLALLILRVLPGRAEGSREMTIEVPSFSYGLFRFLLIPPAFAVIRYLEAHIGM